MNISWIEDNAGLFIKQKIDVPDVTSHKYEQKDILT